MQPTQPFDINDSNYHTAQFSVPWQYGAGGGASFDADGAPASRTMLSGASSGDRAELHAQIWKKFHTNPHVNTSIRGLAGRITGNGFGTVSDIPEIQAAIESTETDYRNRLYDYWPKLLVRGFLAGELPLRFTCHEDGFIEIDFINPDVIQDSEATHGIIFHPRKTRMPLVYCIHDEETGLEEQIPSIYLARYPELIEVAKKNNAFSASKINGCRTRKKAFKSVGGFFQFVVSWDLGLITDRSTSHLQTILKWLNYWEMLKQYEIDHKRSAGAYVWVVKFADVKSWLAWLSLSDQQKKETGISATKTPGSTMVVGPNMEVVPHSPNLPNISNGDADIMQMISSGLNEPEDVVTGQAKGTFASVKASRGPMSDRISDETTYFERWLRYDFWGNIFFLKSKISEFPETFPVKEATRFEDKEPVIETIHKKPEQCIDIMFPVSAVDNIEGQAKALLGVKHGSLYDTAGIPNAVLMKKMGFGNYRQLRLQQATEDETLPKLVLAMDQESMQEQKEAEPGRDKQGNDSSGKTKDNE